MTKYLALRILLGLAIISLVMSQGLPSCNLETQFVYQGSCVSKTCLSTKVSRMQLSVADQILAFKGTLTTGITYSAYKVDTGYEVQIRYKDEEDNQLVSDPIKCLDWRLYQTANEMTVNPSKLWGATASSNYAGEKPLWPVATYKFQSASSEAWITFGFTLKDMEDRQCLKLRSSSSLQYQCFFELDFVLKGITQVSYYYCVQIRLDTNLNTQTAQVQFIPIIQQVGCPPAESVCTVQVKVKSTLSFCETETCLTTQDKSYGGLYLNKVFYMKHEINDIDFKTWLILDVQITMQALGFQLQLSATEFDITKSVAGYNIVKLKVPIVAANVMISIQGQLKESKRMLGERSLLEGNPTSTGVGTQIDLGEVTVLPTDTPNEKSSAYSSSNAALLLTGTTLLFGLID